MKKFYSRFLNKGILYKEVKNVKITVILMTITIFLFKSLQLYNIMNLDYVKNYYDIFNLVLTFNGIQDIGYITIMIILIIIQSVIQMKDDKNLSATSVVFMIPIEKGTIMINKLFIGFLSIFTAFIINIILIGSTIATNKLLLTNVGFSDLAKWSIKNILGYIVIYLLFMIFQVISYSKIESILLGILFTNLPIGVSYIISWCEENFLINESFKYNIKNIFYFLWPINSILNSEFYSLYIDIDDILKNFTYNNSSYSNFSVSNNFAKYNFEPFWMIRVCVLISIIIFLTLLIIYIFNKTSIELQHKNVLTKNIFYQIGALLILGFLFIKLFLKFDVGIHRNFYENPIILAGILCILGMYTTVSLFVAKNIVNRKYKNS